MESFDPPAPERYSCHTSRAAGEPLWAHATRVDRWVALGYDGEWGAKALPESNLSNEVKAHLGRFEREVPNGRVQFIRQGGASFDGEIPLFVARSDSETPWLRRFTLGSYEELLRIDLVALLDGHPPAGEEPAPIFLICVNGRRDLCCARYGQAAYEAFARQAPDRTWQTTHLGGHRFAATGVVLPFGLHYGQLEPDHAGRIVELTDAGRLWLPQLRGRTTLEGPAQAAEHQLRTTLGLDEIDGLVHDATEPLNETSWRVRFRANSGTQLLERTVRKLPDQFRVIKTTGDPEPVPVGHYDVSE